MEQQPLNIGSAAQASGVSAKMIRHYEEIGLFPRIRRTYSGYRTYSPQDIHMLRFIKRARSLGFSIKQIEDLLGLWRDTRRSSSKVKSLAQAHIAELETKIAELEAMRHSLKHLVNKCHGDARPDCPILDELATDSAVTPKTAKSKPKGVTHDCH